MSLSSHIALLALASTLLAPATSWAQDAASDAAVQAQPPTDAEPPKKAESPKQVAPTDEGNRPARDSGWASVRPVDAGSFAPIGVPLDHTQPKGDWTFSYRFRMESSEGLRDGDDDLSVGQVLGNPYTEVPIKQVDETHLLGVSYTPLDRLSFQIELPIVSRVMDVQSAAGQTRHSTSGIGDAKLIFLIPFMKHGDQWTHVTAGFSFPTGSIEQSDSSGQREAYALQLGSGTWDALWGISYIGRWSRLSWGGRFEGLYRIGTNAVGYRLGSRHDASAWLGVNPHRWVSFSARMEWTRRGNIHSEDPTLDKAISPANDNLMQGFNRLDMGPGANFYVPWFGGQRVSVEAMFPVVQSVSGPQLKREVTVTAGWQWIF